ncbi:hypothetical protein F66182_1195 [Fusarium sp. NRRL 66182]|nr:hypothetical protein F66182_1195 [Fusarium sp. NRRL 66182]
MTSCAKHDRIHALEQRLASIEILLTALAGPPPQNPDTMAQMNPTEQDHAIYLQNLDLAGPTASGVSPAPSQDMTNNHRGSSTQSAPQTVTAAIDQMELPPMSEVLPVVDNYFRSFNAIIPLFDETAFMRMLLDWFSLPNKRSMVSWAAINVVLGISYRICQGRNMSDPALAQCIQNVRSIMSEVMTQEEDLLGVQVLLGIVILHQGSSEYKLAVVLIGSVVRMVQSLRLHSKQALAGRSKAEKLQRCRLFWLAYIYDRELAVWSRTTYHQKDSETDIELPEEDPADDLGMITSPGDNVRFNYFRTRVQLAHIQGKANDILYSQESQKLTEEQKIKAITRTEGMLSEWVFCSGCRQWRRI